MPSPDRGMYLVPKPVDKALEELHPPIAEDEDAYAPSGLRKRPSIERDEAKVEMALESLRQKAERLLLPLKDVHDIRLGLDYLIKNKGSIVSEEEEREAREAVERLRKDPLLRELIGSYPAVKENKVPPKHVLDPLYAEMVEVTWALIQEFPLLLARVLQLREAFSSLLSASARARWEEWHRDFSFNFCHMGAFAGIQEIAYEKTSSIHRLREETQKVKMQLSQLKAAIHQKEAELKNQPDEGLGAELEVMHLRRKKLEWREIETSSELAEQQAALHQHMLSTVSFLNPLNWVLEEISDPKTLEYLAIPRSSRKPAPAEAFVQKTHIFPSIQHRAA